MAVIRNINPVQEILQQANIVPRLDATGDKKKALLNALEERGVNLGTVADTIANQFYSSDENVKDKAIERMLKLTDIVRKDDVAALPQVTIVIQGYNQENNLQSILMPRE